MYVYIYDYISKFRGHLLYVVSASATVTAVAVAVALAVVTTDCHTGIPLWSGRTLCYVDVGQVFEIALTLLTVEG